MIEISWYILKVLIVSGILCGYYFLALKDKVFHKWNRFYLLFTVILSLVLPFISIDIASSAAGQGTAIKVLQAVTIQGDNVIEIDSDSSLFSAHNLLISAYLIISLFFMVIMLRTILKIYRLKRSFPNTELKGINFINTDARGTPFSFFNSIFWNRAIDLHTPHGQQIFQHELAHIREKHTHDKVFMNIILLFFWFNPFFWILRKELGMIHEFVADKMAVEEGDTRAFAEMILSSVYPGQKFSITNPFFYSPLKRRLNMLTKNKNAKVNYISRLLVLPLAGLLFFAFSLKMKKTEIGPVYKGKQVTVIIDAGHGGQDGGAREGNYNEKDLNLAIAQQVKNLNNNRNIRILLTRKSDEAVSLKERVQFAQDNHADAFISIHLDAMLQKSPSKGLNIIIPKGDNHYLPGSRILGSSVWEVFKNNYTLPTSGELLQLERGIFILKENQYPAILLQVASLTSENDLAYITKTENQKIVARNILRGIENYAQNILVSIDSETNPVKDTLPANKIDRYQIIQKENKVIITYADGRKETLNKQEAKKRGLVMPPPPAPPAPPTSPAPPSSPKAPLPPTPPALADLPANALYILDGEEADISTIKQIQPGNIHSIHVLKDEYAVNKYGKKGRKGVIELTTKEVGSKQKVTVFPGDSTKEISGIISSKKALIYVDGKMNSAVEKIDPNDIVSVNVYKGEAAIKKFGTQGENGVVEIFTKNKEAAVKEK